MLHQTGTCHAAENSGRPGDVHAFKRQLKFDKPLVEEQCEIVHNLFDAFVKHLTELKWNIFSGTPKTPIILAKFWSSSGFEAISETIAAVLLQVRHYLACCGMENMIVT